MLILCGIGSSATSCRQKTYFRQDRSGLRMGIFSFLVVYLCLCGFAATTTSGFVLGVKRTKSAGGLLQSSAPSSRSRPLRTSIHNYPRDDSLYNNDRSNNQDALLQSLKLRTQELLNSEKTIPLVMIPGCILPRQVVTVKVQSADFLSQVIRQKDSDIPRFGLVGMTRRAIASSLSKDQTAATAKTEMLSVGVEVEVLSASHVVVQQSLLDAAPDPPTTEALIELKVRGVRMFEIVDTLTDFELGQAQGWIPGKVRFLDLATLEKQEPDPFQVALAMQQAQEFTNANNSMKESKSLVDMWLDLARTKETYKGQLDRLLEELGEMPSWEEPSECAYWVAALINPTPSMGLAVDIRMGLLTSQTALERTQLVLNAIWNSIQRMDETTPRFVKIKE